MIYFKPLDKWYISNHEQYIHKWVYTKVYLHLFIEEEETPPRQKKGASDCETWLLKMVVFEKSGRTEKLHVAMFQ